MSLMNTLYEALNDSIITEAVSKEERAKYIKFSRALKKKLQKDLGIKLVVRVSSSSRPNPWIHARAKSGETIPNEFRKKVAKALGVTPKNLDDVSYGNIRSHEVALHHSDWIKVVGEL